MSDTQWLLIVVVVIYLTDCVGWAGSDCLAFVSRCGSRWRWTTPCLSVGNGKWGPVWHFPLPPLGQWHLCQLWPLSISPDGVFADVSHSLGRDEYAPRPGAYLAFSDVRKVETASRELLVNGGPFSTAASETCARQLARLIQSLAKLPHAARTAAIEQALATRMDAAAIGRRMAEHREQSATLRPLCNGLFLWIFLVVPLVSWSVGWLRTWPYFAAVGVLLVGLIVWTFLRSFVALFPDVKGQRVEKAVMLVLNPLSAIRAHDALARDVLAEFHPLAAANVLCPSDEYRRLAKVVVVDSHHPLEPLFAEAPPVARDIGQWYREREREAVTRFLASTGLDPTTLLAPDPPLDDTCRTYCPRCQCQYVLEEGCCLPCGRIKLVPFART